MFFFEMRKFSCEALSRHAVTISQTQFVISQRCAFLTQKTQTYDEGFVCFSHKAVIKRADMIFQTAFVDCSKLLKKDYWVFWQVEGVGGEWKMSG